MNGESPPKQPAPADPSAEGQEAVPRTGSGADTALAAMLRKRRMRAGAEPQAPQPDGKKGRKK